MSAPASASADATDETARIDFDYYRDIGRAALEEQARKVEQGRIRSAENERVRNQQVKTLFYGIDTMRKLEESRTLNELSEEIDALKAARGDRP